MRDNFPQKLQNYSAKAFLAEEFSLALIVNNWHLLADPVSDDKNIIVIKDSSR